MATKSMLKTVSIKDNRSARSLIHAFEYAPKKHSQPVTIPYSVSDASKKEIEYLFGTNK